MKWFEAEICRAVDCGGLKPRGGLEWLGLAWAEVEVCGVLA